MVETLVFVFAKYPRPGAVKTRLIPVLGDVGSARLAEAFILDLTARLTLANLGPAVRFVLCFDPPDALESFRKLLTQEPKIAPIFELLPQVSGGLGDRLQAAARHAFERGCGAVFIGTDAPDLPLNEIRRGIDCTKHGSACIQFATDGGYVLLALPASASEAVFADIEWSKPTTGKQQASRIRELDIPLVESATVWPDVDEPVDLLPLKNRLEQDPNIAPRTLAVLRELL